MNRANKLSMFKHAFEMGKREYEYIAK